jgi:hypothetical protein
MRWRSASEPKRSRFGRGSKLEAGRVPVETAWRRSWPSRASIWRRAGRRRDAPSAAASEGGGGRAPGGDDARNEEYAPRLEAERVRDAEGRIVGDDGDHFADLGVRDAKEALSVKDYRHMMARRAGTSSFEPGLIEAPGRPEARAT